MEHKLPYWYIEEKYFEGVEEECIEAQNLYDALMTGVNSVWIKKGNKPREIVGFVRKNWEIVLFGKYDGMSESELKLHQVKFDRLSHDNDGFTIAIYKEK